jgi:hypothetical protein
MNISNIKKEIKSKFRTISRFAEISEIPEKDLRYFLSGKMSSVRSSEYEKSINKLIKATKPKPDPRFITDSEREYVRIGIVLNFRSIRRFTNKYPEFTIPFISNIITGRRLIRTKRFFKLINLLDRVNKIEIIEER